MWYLRGMPCEAAVRRGHLSHSWLKNQILTMDATFVARMHSVPSLWEEKEFFERKIEAGGEFFSRVGQTRQLVQDMVHGFSPDQLVDYAPLMVLSEKARRGMKSVLHRQYLNESLIEDQAVRILAAIADFENALNGFAASWYQQPPVRAEVIRTWFEEVQNHARTLHEALSKLPEGIVLP